MRKKKRAFRSGDKEAAKTAEKAGCQNQGGERVLLQKTGTQAEGEQHERCVERHEEHYWLQVEWPSY